MSASGHEGLSRLADYSVCRRELASRSPQGATKYDKPSGDFKIRSNDVHHGKVPNEMSFSDIGSVVVIAFIAEPMQLLAQVTRSATATPRISRAASSNGLRSSVRL